MTYPDNRNRNRGGDNTATWIIGAIAAIAVIGAIAWGLSSGNDQTASTTTPPAATTGQTGTAGQSGNAPANNPAPANR